MAGISDPQSLDLVVHAPATNEYVLIMVEDRPWMDSVTQIEELRQKINNYAMFALDGALLDLYPQTAGAPLRIQLDCIEEPSQTVRELIEVATARLSQFSIGFTVNLLTPTAGGSEISSQDP